MAIECRENRGQVTIWDEVRACCSFPARAKVAWTGAVTVAKERKVLERQIWQLESEILPWLGFKGICSHLPLEHCKPGSPL